MNRQSLNKRHAALARSLITLLPRFRQTLYAGITPLEPWLTRAKVVALSALNTEGAQTMTALHNATGLEKGSVTPIVDDLILRKKVTRETDEHDRRKTIIQLTKEGRALAEQLEANLSRHVSEKLKQLSDSDVQRLITAVEIFTDIQAKLSSS